MLVWVCLLVTSRRFTRTSWLSRRHWFPSSGYTLILPKPCFHTNIFCAAQIRARSLSFWGCEMRGGGKIRWLRNKLHGLEGHFCIQPLTCWLNLWYLDKLITCNCLFGDWHCLVARLFAWLCIWLRSRLSRHGLGAMTGAFQPFCHNVVIVTISMNIGVSIFMEKLVYKINLHCFLLVVYPLDLTLWNYWKCLRFPQHHQFDMTLTLRFRNLTSMLLWCFG